MIDISEDNFAGSTPEILGDFTCMLCYGVALNPVKCNKCETVYCSKCLPAEALPGAESNNAPRSYNNPRYECYKKCGSKKTCNLSRIERNILNNLKFKCQHAEEYNCKKVVKYEFLAK